MKGRPLRRGEPAHVVVDNEALGQLGTGRPARPLLVALEAAAATGGRVVLPTCVIVERDHNRTDPGAAAANRVLRNASADALTSARAEEAVTLRRRSRGRRSRVGGSVVDAHVVVAALGAVRQFGGTATIATSDPGDITRLLDAAVDIAVRTSVTVQSL